MIDRILCYVERKAAYYQGKGWGAGTVKLEVSQALKLLDTKNLKLCIDIGGNKGAYTEEIINQFPSSKVVLFEPASANVRVLKDKFSRFENVLVEPFAVSSSTGETVLYSDKEGSGLASLSKRKLDHFNIKFDKTEAIQTILFESYWKNSLDCQPIDLCKIDIEGHELDALNGFGEALKHINIIQFEFGGCNIDTRNFF